MREFLEIVAENAVKYKDKVILADDTVKGITFGQYNALAGRVYAYLKKNGIGREDFVLICLPRGVQPLIALYGVWRAGAAFVIVEDNYAPERIEFIKKDCGCKIVIDARAWEEIQHLDPLEGSEPVDKKDAAFAVYTSGTTGNPKGVLHEYGNLDRMYLSAEMTTCAPLTEPDDRFALVAPLNFVASLLIVVYGLAHANFNYVVSYSVVKNPMQMMMFLLKNRITGTFLTPSYIRKMTKKPPMLKFCIIGSEPANEVYLEGLTIHNFYLMSESGFAVTHFLIDKKYEATPVGKSECGYEVKLLDETGAEVPDGEEGEVCFDNPYVRGYINLPEQTAEVFKDGMYHTGDLARKDEEGRLIICGRMNDMVKINGNRVEPGEIEGVAKKVMGVNWTAARIFDDGRKVFICVYYTDKKKIDFEKTRKEMEQYLPYYMLPSFFIHIDEVPLRPNGKMDRKALPAPNFDDYQDDYVAPEDDVQKALCNAFEKVLERQRIGIRDDFYQLGGDSMGSMEVIVQSKLPGLTTTDIFRGHTPEKIAELYRTHMVEGENPDEINDKALGQVHTLTAEQLYMIDYQLYTPDSTMYNLYNMVKFDKNIMDMDMLTAAVNAAVRNQPVFMTEFFFNEDGDICQRYSENDFEEITLEHVTEAELREIEKTLVHPFKIIKSKLVRFRIFETEEAGYLFMDVHHTIFDGTSSKVFFTNVMTAYAGQDLPKDYYYYILDRRERQQNSDFYRESKEYFEKRYGGVDWCKHLTVDRETRENTANEIFVMLPVDETVLDKLNAKYGVSRNGFFITVSAIANAIYEKKADIMLSWIYNGRNDMNEMNSVGLLFRNLPVGIRFTQKMTIKELFEDVIDQINKAITHSCYPYVEGNNNVVEDDLACVLYQDNLRNLDEIPGLLGEVELENEKLASQNIMDLEILNQDEGIVMMVDYAASLYKPESVDRYRKIYCATIDALIDHVGEEDITILKLGREISKASKEGGFLSENWWLKWMRKK